MAYNKGRKVFRNRSALKKQKDLERREVDFFTNNMDYFKEEEMNSFVKRTRLKGKNDVLKELQNQGMDYVDLPYLLHNSNSKFKLPKGMTSNEWNRTVQKMIDKYNDINHEIENKNALNKLTQELKSVFDTDQSRVSKNITTFMFNDPPVTPTGPGNINLSKGVEIIDKFGKDFVKLMSPGVNNQTAKDLVKSTIENVNDLMVLTGNNMGKTNQSIHSIELARQNLKRTGNLVVFDLETFGGKDINTRANMFDRITEISFRNINLNTGVEENKTALLGIDERTMNKYVDKIHRAMQDGTFRQDSDLGVIASRLARYGQSTVEKKDGLVKVVSFPGDDFDKNLNTDLDAIKRGANVLIDAYNYSQSNLITTSSGIQIDAGTKMLIDNARNLQKIFMSGDGVVAGYNHIEYDIPFLNSRLQKMYHGDDQNVIKYMDEVFKGNISLDPITKGGSGAINKTLLDMRSVVETATNMYGISAMYGNDTTMRTKVGATPNRQEYIGEAYQQSMFRNPDGTMKAEAHKADFDTDVLKNLIVGRIDNPELRASMNIPDNYNGSALDYMLDHITRGGYEQKGGILRRGKRFDFDPTKKQDAYFMVGSKDRARSANFAGSGHLDFTYNTETKEFMFANAASTNEFDNRTGKTQVEASEYYKSMNKNAVYQISAIKKFDPSEEFMKEVNELYPEYGSGQLYALEFKAVTDNARKDSVLGTQRHVKVFKTFDEMEGFLSSQMDLVAVRENGELKLKNDYREKLNIIDGSGIDHSRTDQQVFDDYIKGSSEKIEKDTSRRYFLDKEKSYERIKKLIAFSDALEADDDLKNLSVYELNKKYSHAVASASNGKKIETVEENLQKMLIKNVGYKDKQTGDRKIYRATAHNAINALEFIKSNRELMDNVIKEVDSITRSSDGRNYLAGHNNETASHILKNVLNEIALDNPGSGQKNELYQKQMMNTFDVEVKGIYNRRNTDLVNTNVYLEEDMISLSNLYDKNANYTFLNKLMNARYSNVERQRMSDVERENAQRLMIEKFMKDSNYEWKDDLKDVETMMKDDQFNPLEASERIIASMRKQKEKNKHAGIINLNFTEGFENLSVDAIDMAKLKSRDPDYIKNIAQKYKNVKHINNKNMQSNIDAVVNNLISFNKNQIGKSIIENYGSVNDVVGKKELQIKNLLYDNARRDIRNIVEDLFYSAQQAGAHIEADDQGGIALRQGNKLVNVVIPKLKMAQNGMMYVQYGSQNIKLRHKVLIDDDGAFEMGTSINDVYRVSRQNGKIIHKNANRVKRAMEEGTFELGDIADYFKKNLKDLSEDAKMVTIRGGDYYSNMNIDAKDFINKAVFAIFGNKDDDQYKGLEAFRDVILNSELYDEKFVQAFGDKFGRTLKDGSISPDALLYMARESPLMLSKFLNHMANTTGNKALAMLADNINIGSKKQETETGIYALGEQRTNVILSDLWNNHARPVSGGSGNFHFMKVNSDTINIKGSTAPEIKKGALISNQHYDAINGMMENGEEYISSARVKTLYAGDMGLDAIVKYQFNDVIKNNTVDKAIAEKTYAQIRANISVFEQQKLLDPLVFEKLYGSNVAADTKYFSKGLDLIGALTEEDNIDDKTIEMLERIKKVLPSISYDDTTGNFTFTSGVSEVVSRDDKVFEHKGFGGIKESFNSRLRAGMFGFTVQNAEGIELTDAEITRILNLHKDELLNSGADMRNVALNILEREGYAAKFGVKDINKISLPKMNAGSGEKSMTTLLYAKTGSVDSDIRDVFKTIQEKVFDNKVGIVDNTVLREDAVLGMLNRYDAEGGDLNKLLANFAGNNLDAKKANLLQRLAKEQMSYRDIIFGHGKLKGISAISNDAIAKHKNIGMMMENNLANAISLLSKYMDGTKAGGTDASYSNALDFVINKINSDNKYAIFRNESISGFEGGDFSAKESVLKVTRGKHDNILVDGLRFTDREHTIIDGESYGNLIERIDREISKQASKNGMTREIDDNLFSKDFYKVNPKTGQVELVKDVHVGQALFITDKDGKNIMAGSIVEDIMSFVFDPETQTDIDYRYIDARRGIASTQREIRILEEQKKKATNKNRIQAQIDQKEKELQKLREEASGYKVKHMRYTHTDERLLLSHNLDKAMVNRLNSANVEAGRDIIDEFASDRLKSILKKNGDTYELNITDKDMSTSVYKQFTDRMRNLRRVKDGETILTEDMLKDDKYAHLSGIFNNIKRAGGDVGVESAQEMYDLNRAFEAFNFNKVGTGSAAGYKDVEDMKALGFEVRGIRDISYIESSSDLQQISEANIIDKNVIVDLGSTFSDDDRYLALPGLGKIIGDDDDAQTVKRGYQSKLNTLKRAYDDYSRIGNAPDAQAEINGKMLTKEERRQRVLDAANDVKETLNQNLFDKKGAITKSGVIDMPMVTARQKITGTGFILNQESSAFDKALGGSVDDLNKAFESGSAMAKATINGTSVLDWEKRGVHYDYAFVSEDIFRSMGFLDEKNLKAMGLTEDEMIMKLETEGIDTLAVRYPEIYDSSMINTKMFLDRTVGNNSVRFAEHTMRKFNGDVDGDSASFLMLESENGMNSMIYQKYKKDMETQGLTQQQLANKLKADGYDYKKDYMLFEQSQIKAEADAFTVNRFWREDARKIRQKDYLKNMESTIDAVSGQKHRNKITNLVSESQLKRVDASVDNMLNDAMDVIKQMEQKDPDIVNSKAFQEKYGTIAKLLNEVREDTTNMNGYKISSVRDMKNPTNLMNEALSVIKDYGDLNQQSQYSKGRTLGSLVSDTGNYTVATDVRKMYNELFIEQNNKTGAAAIGSVNVKLVPLKRASRKVLTDGTPDSVVSDTIIQEVAAMIEQNAINFKKQEATGNQAAVTEMNEALYKSMNGKWDEGKKLLETWFSNISGDDAFAGLFNNVIEMYSQENQSTIEAVISESMATNKISRDVAKSNWVRDRFVNTIGKLSDNEMARGYFKNPIGTGRSDRSAMYNVMRIMEEGIEEDIMNDVIGKDVYSGLEEARAAQKLNAERIEKTKAFASSISSSSAERPVRSLVSEGAGTLGKLMGHRSSGLAMGVIGLASGLLISGFASGNPLQQDESPYLSNSNNSQPQSIPEFFDQEGGYAQQSNNGGYIINVRADTKKGKKQLERTMKKVAKQGFGNVSVNMSVRDKNKPKSNQDIQNWIESNL